ncbi:patatin-like phospholipase family protein, partial [Brachyspira hampsonii]
MDKLGLVFDGGGGKGAYQIGVWKYLKEVGLDRNIKTVSGASVGALNACLFALDDYNLAEKIWTREIKNKI